MMHHEDRLDPLLQNVIDCVGQFFHAGKAIGCSAKTSQLSLFFFCDLQRVYPGQTNSRRVVLVSMDHKIHTRELSVRCNMNASFTRRLSSAFPLATLQIQQNDIFFCSLHVIQTAGCDKAVFIVHPAAGIAPGPCDDIFLQQLPSGFHQQLPLIPVVHNSTPSFTSAFV